MFLGMLPRRSALAVSALLATMQIEAQPATATNPSSGHSEGWAENPAGTATVAQASEASSHPSASSTSGEASAYQRALEQLVARAVEVDPWLSGSQHREAALQSEAIAFASLPDPRISVGAANVPLDTLNFNQEPMTQLAVGISQRFPRGDSLTLAQQHKRDLAAEQPLLREDRKASIRRAVSLGWLEAWASQRSIDLIEQDYSLFLQLVDAATNRYASALGLTRQQDVLRAQLELIRLDDRLQRLRQLRDQQLQQLSQWLGETVLPQELGPSTTSGATTAESVDELAVETPDLTPAGLAELLNTTLSRAQRQQRLAQHPALLAMEQRIHAAQTGVELTRQKYKPEWGVTAQYGYRDDDPFGNQRADFFSVGINFDLPLFTANRQDREMSAVVSRAEALRTEQQLLQRRLVSELETALTQRESIEQRLALYADRLLPQMAEQTNAALNAYNADDGDFAEVVRARIDQLNTKIEALGLGTAREKQHVVIEYLLADGARGQLSNTHQAQR